MNQPLSNPASTLDQIRQEKGTQECQSTFHQSYQESPAKALQLLEEEISFPCLFVLQPQIEALNLLPRLNREHMLALNIVKQISASAQGQTSELLAAKRESVHAALLWMIQSGAGELSLGERYEKVVDIAVAVLLNTYQDQEILPTAAELIFLRGKQGHHLHDLVWAYFKTHKPLALQLLAAHIQAEDPQEVDLACKLLSIKPPSNPSPAAKKAAYSAYLNWLAENGPFLYFSGESLQYTNSPNVCQVDLARKYLQQETTTYSQTPLRPANPQEARRLERFLALSQQEQARLANYSQALQHSNQAAWASWLESPIQAQVADSKTRGRA